VIFNGDRNAGTFDEIEVRYRELRIRLEVESLLPDSKDGPP
jgi:hypothetical protein